MNNAQGILLFSEASVYIGGKHTTWGKMFWVLQIINISISTQEHDKRAFWLLKNKKKTKSECFSEDDTGEEERYNVL